MGPGTDDEQLRAMFDRLCRAWTDGDAQAYGACFTEDCDYVAFDGSLTRGAGAVADSHDRLFRGVLTGTALVGEVASIRHLSDGVALLHGTGSVLVAWRSRPPKGRATRNTIVAVRTPQGWRIAAIHNGRIRPVTVPAPDSLPSRAARGLVRLTGSLGIGHAAHRRRTGGGK